MSDQDDKTIPLTPESAPATLAAEPSVTQADSQVVVLAERAEPAKPPRVLAIATQQGGVGKTTTAINLGTALAAIGERVLVIDLDPQGNASTGLGIDRRNRRVSTYDVLIGEAALRDAVVPTAVPRLHIAASTMDLSGLELELGSTRDRAFRLRDASCVDKIPLFDLAAKEGDGRALIVMETQGRACFKKSRELDFAIKALKDRLIRSSAAR